MTPADALIFYICVFVEYSLLLEYSFSPLHVILVLSPIFLSICPPVISLPISVILFPLSVIYWPSCPFVYSIPVPLTITKLPDVSVSSSTLYCCISFLLTILEFPPPTVTIQFHLPYSVLFIKMILCINFITIWSDYDSNSFLLTILIDIALVTEYLINLFLFVLQALLNSSKFSLDEELSGGSGGNSQEGGISHCQSVVISLLREHALDL